MNMTGIIADSDGVLSWQLTNKRPTFTLLHNGDFPDVSVRL